VSDFAHFLVLDLESDESTRFSLDEFPDRVDLFDFVTGYRRRTFDDEQDAVSVEAAELMGDLFNRLSDNGYRGHELKLLLVRLLFILFDDDTAIWQRGLFQEYVELKTSVDGRDLGPALDLLFQVLNVAMTELPKRRRATTDVRPISTALVPDAVAGAVAAVFGAGGRRPTPASSLMWTRVRTNRSTRSGGS